MGFHAYTEGEIGRFLPDKAINLIDEAGSRAVSERLHPVHLKAEYPWEAQYYRNKRTSILIHSQP
ncbi:hypothetical protein RJ639_026652 [Escallonia herrerae]|uniref:ClpA/ClpB AAA lid domain-containing protein n=1 Tax=Escallonia herrerae TaxID=1293975 RepID=A0AA88UYA0_9ASTE|nr:hypothetical protein RJ639_026652 [Escallonia herrerae]